MDTVYMDAHLFPKNSSQGEFESIHPSLLVWVSVGKFSLVLGRTKKKQTKKQKAEIQGMRLCVLFTMLPSSLGEITH